MALDLPASLRAGDSLSQTVDLTDYPAGPWTLAYTLSNAAGKQTVTASASGTSHVVALAPSTTATWTPGRYTWVATASKTGSRKTLATGTIDVLPDLAGAGAGVDTRSHAQKVLEAIEAVIANRATLDQQSYTINGRSLSRTPLPELLQMRALYRAEVAGERVAERLAAGLGGRNRLLVRL